MSIKHRVKWSGNFMLNLVKVNNKSTQLKFKTEYYIANWGVHIDKINEIK
jgi:hypothetical protein